MSESAHQGSEGIHTHGRIAVGHQPSLSHFGLDTPAPEVLHGPLGEILALGNVMNPSGPLYQDDVDTPLAQVDGQPQPDRATTDDCNLGLHVRETPVGQEAVRQVPPYSSRAVFE
jgi:hypothetical protein